ncbi:PPR repeat [Musa troglodytarum]|uniref:PPR repeat n=1 Tax=Musa troglodytarum TaxID=320322 RepID=A0A9E7KCK0_9LILI|nr:PPR repeat [Musa troglodytarum]
MFLQNVLLNMYCKCGDMSLAQRLFDTMPTRDTVSWNSLITGYSQVGVCRKSLHVFNEARSQRVFLTNSLIDMYSKCGGISDASLVFDSSSELDDVTWNSMISAYVRIGWDEETLRTFAKMHRLGIKLNPFALGSVLKSSSSLSNSVILGKMVHGCVIKVGLDSDVFVGSAMIDLYAKNGLLSEAVMVFNSVPDPNVVVFNSMIAGFSRSDSIEEGFKCFHSVPKQDIVTWTSMISGCVQVDHFEQALSLFHDLLGIGIKPDHFTLSCLMSACANLAVARSGEQIQCYAIKVGFNWFTIINNSQIFMYARSGDVDAANQTFQEMENRDVVSWSAMISSHAQHGCASDALMLFKEMEGCKVSPNHVTLLGVLTACSHGGLVDEGLRYFERMKVDYDLDPNAKHCACIVDLLGRAGRLVDAEKFILDSGFHDDPVLWRALLGSCRVHKDTEMGTHAAERIMELEPHAPASYVLLYNMHLDAGRKSFAMRARGDNSHPESHAIYDKLEEMLSKIEKMGLYEDGGFGDQWFQSKTEWKFCEPSQ